MFVKICGTTSLADAQMALAEGADALGFIFAPSRRQVSIEQVSDITSQLSREVARVGVFTHPDVEEIAQTVRSAGLTVVQLHMPQDADLLTRLNAEFGAAVELWQVVRFEVAAAEGAERDAADQAFKMSLVQASSDARISAVLVDTAVAGASGGLGMSFPWARAAVLIEQVREQVTRSRGHELPRQPRLIVAGGLRPDNVAEATRELQPWGVDCVSGVEAAPGRKDRHRLAAFIRAARDGG